MNKNNMLSKPALVGEKSFDEFYESFAADWEKRAQRLRIRRWKQLKQKLV